MTQIGVPAVYGRLRSSSPLRESPSNLEQCSKEAIIAEAKWIVDARCTLGPTR